VAYDVEIGFHAGESQRCEVDGCAGDGSVEHFKDMVLPIRDASSTGSNRTSAVLNSQPDRSTLTELR
jgi:hypothetical protein